MHTVTLGRRREDIDVLLDRQPPISRVLRVAEHDDPHAMLAEALAGRPAAVHLVTHGPSGEVRLGARR